MMAIPERSSRRCARSRKRRRSPGPGTPSWSGPACTKDTCSCDSRASRTSPSSSGTPRARSRSSTAKARPHRAPVGGGLAEAHRLDHRRRLRGPERLGRDQVLQRPPHRPEGQLHPRQRSTRGSWATAITSASRGTSSPATASSPTTRRATWSTASTRPERTSRSSTTSSTRTGRTASRWPDIPSSRTATPAPSSPSPPLAHPPQHDRVPAEPGRDRHLAGGRDRLRHREQHLLSNAVTLGPGDCQGIDFVGAGGGHVIRNNLFFGPERTSIAGKAGDYAASDNLEDKDPLFVDADRFDFRLRKGSPAIDSGGARAS